jgi:predicted amino acid dehydrogenase
MGPGPGIPGWFIALFIVFVMAGIGMTVWRVSVARRMAEDAGLDPKKATAVAMLSNDGIDATYLASTLASHSRAQPPHATQAAKTAEQRLQELQALRDKGLVTDDEYEAQRQKILGSI